MAVRSIWRGLWKNVGIINLKRIATSLLLVATSVSCIAPAGYCQYTTLPSFMPQPGYYRSDRLLIRLQPGVPQATVDRIINSGFQLIKRIDGPNGFTVLVVKTPWPLTNARMDVARVIRYFQFQLGVYSQIKNLSFDYKLTTLSCENDEQCDLLTDQPGAPTDRLFPSQCNLGAMRFAQARKAIAQLHRRPNGQFVPLEPVDIDIIDTGANRIFAGETNVPVVGEMSSIVQYDCTSETAPPRLETPYDPGSQTAGNTVYHGTGVTSIAASLTNDRVGIAGVASMGPYMSRVYARMCRISHYGSPDSYISSAIEALAFLANNRPNQDANLAVYFGQRPLRLGRRPILMCIGNAQTGRSLHTDENVQDLAEVLKSQGSLVVMASGNSGLTDDSPEQSCVLVDATDNEGHLLASSNRGVSHVKAPGSQVLSYSYSNNGRYVVQHMSGTSAAAATWAGSLALLMSIHPGFTVEQVNGILKARIINSQTPVVNLESAARAVLKY